MFVIIFLNNICEYSSIRLSYVSWIKTWKRATNVGSSCHEKNVTIQNNNNNNNNNYYYYL